MLRKLNLNKGGRTMTLKSHFSFRKLLSVFLAVLTVMSIFSVNVYADFQGSDSTSAGSGTVAGNYHITTVSNDESLVVGYRFSIVNTSGSTLKDNNGQYKIIDVIRSSLPTFTSTTLILFLSIEITFPFCSLSNKFL